MEVYYHNRHVGTLKEGTKDNHLFFSYSSSWLKDGFSISPLLMPLEKKVYECNRAHLRYLHGVFHDCLPDTWGNVLINRYLRKQNINPASLNMLSRLSLLGKDSLGALTFVPSNPLNEASDIADLDKIKEELTKLLEGKEIDEDAFLDAYSRGSSAGGSRPKINIIRNGEPWIVKFPSLGDKDNIGKMEYDYNLAAKEAGLEVSDFELLPSKKCQGYFATKRFDRDKNGIPIHRISLAGLFEADIDYPQLDYLTLLQTTVRLCREDVPQAFRIMCFNLFAGNFDDHGKNFSFLYNEEEKRYRLAPSYDLTTIPGGRYHQLGFGRKDEPTKKDLLELGAKVGLHPQQMETIMKEVLQVVLSRLKGYYDFTKHENWSSFSSLI